MSGGLLWGRAAVLSVVALGSGAVAHAMADGRVPGPLVLLLIGVGTTAGCAALLRRPASRLRVVLLTMAGQTWVHLCLTASAGHRGDGVATGAMHAMPGMDTPTAAASQGGASYFDHYSSALPAGAGDAGPALPAPVLHVLADLTGAHAPMMLMHLAAAALVGLWLAVGEHALWGLLAALTGAFAVLWIRAVPARRCAAPLPADAPAVPPHDCLRACGMGRRGPPYVLAA